MPEINDRRAVIIEDIFLNYDFKDCKVKDANGWEHYAPNSYKRVFFLDKEDQPSRRAVFNIDFKPGTLEVLIAGF
jgi:hypothetical protein